MLIVFHQKMLNIILFGAPGAGKGTQSQKLIERFGLIHLSTGDLLRSEIATSTDLGLAAKHIMDEGKLVSDEIVIGMIENKLKSNLDAKGFIFDGFPRTIPQAEALDQMLLNYNESITCMLALNVPDEELVNRLVKRGESSGRADDNEETIRKRLAVYNEQTSIVADHYKNQSKFVNINGVGLMDDVFEDICSQLQILSHS